MWSGLVNASDVIVLSSLTAWSRAVNPCYIPQTTGWQKDCSNGFCLYLQGRTVRAGSAHPCLLPQAGTPQDDGQSIASPSAYVLLNAGPQRRRSVYNTKPSSNAWLRRFDVSPDELLRAKASVLPPKATGFGLALIGRATAVGRGTARTGAVRSGSPTFPIRSTQDSGLPNAVWLME